MISSIFWLILLGFITWFWFDTLRTRERAKGICKHTCRELQLQLLDDTIALVRLRLRRDRRGRLRLQRSYQFEFSEGSNHRLQGMVVMRGLVLEMLELPGYMDRTISLV